MYTETVDDIIRNAINNANNGLDKTAESTGDLIPPTPPNAQGAPAGYTPISNGTARDMAQKMKTAAMAMGAGGVEVPRATAQDGPDPALERTPDGTQPPDPSMATMELPALDPSMPAGALPGGDAPDVVGSEVGSGDPALERTTDGTQPPDPSMAAQGFPPPEPTPTTLATAADTAAKRQAEEVFHAEKLGDLLEILDDDGILGLIKKEAIHAEKAAQAGMSWGKKGLIGLGITGGLVGGGLVGAHLANKDEPQIAQQAFGQGYDIGQEETANAIYNAIVQAQASAANNTGG